MSLHDEILAMSVADNYEYPPPCTHEERDFSAAWKCGFIKAKSAAAAIAQRYEAAKDAEIERLTRERDEARAHSELWEELARWAVPNVDGLCIYYAHGDADFPKLLELTGGTHSERIVPPVEYLARKEPHD